MGSTCKPLALTRAVNLAIPSFEPSTEVIIESGRAFQSRVRKLTGSDWMGRNHWI